MPPLMRFEQHVPIGVIIVLIIQIVVLARWSQGMESTMQANRKYTTTETEKLAVKMAANEKLLVISVGQQYARDTAIAEFKLRDDRIARNQRDIADIHGLFVAVDDKMNQMLEKLTELRVKNGGGK